MYRWWIDGIVPLDLFWTKLLRTSRILKASMLNRHLWSQRSTWHLAHQGRSGALSPFNGLTSSQITIINFSNLQSLFPPAVFSFFLFFQQTPRKTWQGKWTIFPPESIACLSPSNVYSSSRMDISGGGKWDVITRLWKIDGDGDTEESVLLDLTLWLILWREFTIRVWRWTTWLMLSSNPKTSRSHRVVKLKPVLRSAGFSHRS